ncbi:MAG TPA: efflux transporter outer membrane subunit [Burkholderiales bacterium]|nr:efflux transporter outer membrane subunit [Burkholderiales bacterium]
MRSSREGLGSSLGLCVLLCGCALGPDYSRPQIESPAAYRIDYPKAADVANTKWWEQFGDPALNQLVEDALRGNLDVKQAAARVERFLGALRTTRSQFFPQFGYGGDVSRNRASTVGQPPLGPGVDPNYSLYQASLNADWQIDLFGRVRRQSEQAQAAVYASEQGRRGVILSLVATTASAYINLRALDRQLQIAQDTAKNYGETQSLFGLRLKGGVISDVEMSQIESQYQAALAAIPALEFSIAQQENLISILLGRNPGPISRARTIDELTPPAIPAGLPAELLERRPDILQAEQNLVAANANIGATKALYFPSFSITGAYGWVSTAASDFLTGPARAWTAALGVSGPLFTFGAIEGQVRSSEAARDEAVLFYQQAILNALQETNNALVGSQKTSEQAEAQARRVRALRNYARLSRARFDNGAASYVEVLVAENDLFTAELNAVSAQADRLTQIINVYKAMGGGWVDLGDQIAAPVQPASPPK